MDEVTPVIGKPGWVTVNDGIDQAAAEEAWERQIAQQKARRKFVPRPYKVR